MAREFIVPGEIFTGAGALDMAEAAMKKLGKKALIVTDKVMIELGKLCQNRDSFEKSGHCIQCLF